MADASAGDTVFCAREAVIKVSAASRRRRSVLDADPLHRLTGLLPQKLPNASAVTLVHKTHKCNCLKAENSHLHVPAAVCAGQQRNMDFLHTSDAFAERPRGWSEKLRA